MFRLSSQSHWYSIISHLDTHMALDRLSILSFSFSLKEKDYFLVKQNIYIEKYTECIYTVWIPVKWPCACSFTGNAPWDWRVGTSGCVFPTRGPHHFPKWLPGCSQQSHEGFHSSAPLSPLGIVCHLRFHSLGECGVASLIVFTCISVINNIGESLFLCSLAI